MNKERKPKSETISLVQEDLWTMTEKRKGNIEFKSPLRTPDGKLHARVEDINPRRNYLKLITVDFYLALTYESLLLRDEGTKP